MINYVKSLGEIYQRFARAEQLWRKLYAVYAKLLASANLSELLVFAIEDHQVLAFPS